MQPKKARAVTRPMTQYAAGPVYRADGTTQLTTKADPRFVELRSSILDQIRHERSASHL